MWHQLGTGPSQGAREGVEPLLKARDPHLAGGEKTVVDKFKRMCLFRNTLRLDASSCLGNVIPDILETDSNSSGKIYLGSNTKSIAEKAMNIRIKSKTCHSSRFIDNIPWDHGNLKNSRVNI